MHFSKIFYVVLSAILVTIFMLIIYIFPTYSGSGRTQGKGVKIYFADNISPAHRKLINLFNEKYKGQIEVVPLDLPFNKFSTNDRKELLARYFRSKSDRIDVFSVDQIWVPRFAKWAIPLDEYFPDSLKSSILKYALKTCYYNDTLVAIPLYIDIALMYYRKDLINRLNNSKQIEEKLRNSITWEDLIGLNKKFPKNPLFVFQADDFEGVICIYTEILANMKGKIIEGDSLLLNTSQAEKALQFLDDLVNKYKISPSNVLRFKEDDSYNYYLQNNGVFLRGWTGLFKNNKVGSIYSSLDDSIEEVPTPHLKGSQPNSVFGGWNLMVSKFSANVPEAMCFVKFLMSKEAQEILFEDGGYIPINNSIYNDSLYRVKNPALSFYESLLKIGIYRPFSEQYTIVSDVLAYYVNLSVRGSLSPHDALNKAYNKLNSKSILLK
jgi:multiple sugar transport system substrate-binding protein